MAETRCSHGMLGKRCVVPTCTHWDGRHDATPTVVDRSTRLKRRRDRAREQYAARKAKQERIADAMAEGES